WQLWARRGRAWLEERDWEQAARDLSAAIDRGAEDPSVWLDRGQASAEQGRFREAAADVGRAQAMGVVHVEPLQALALLAAGDRAAYQALAARILAFLNTKAEESDPIELLLWPLVLPAGETFDLSKPIGLLGKKVARGRTGAEDLRTLGAA